MFEFYEEMVDKTKIQGKKIKNVVSIILVVCIIEGKPRVLDPGDDTFNVTILNHLSQCNFGFQRHDILVNNCVGPPQMKGEPIRISRVQHLLQNYLINPITWINNSTT